MSPLPTGKATPAQDYPESPLIDEGFYQGTMHLYDSIKQRANQAGETQWYVPVWFTIEGPKHQGTEIRKAWGLTVYPATDGTNKPMVDADNNPLALRFSPKMDAWRLIERLNQVDLQEGQEIDLAQYLEGRSVQIKVSTYNPKKGDGAWSQVESWDHVMPGSGETTAMATPEQINRVNELWEKAKAKGLTFDQLKQFLAYSGIPVKKSEWTSAQANRATEFIANAAGEPVPSSDDGWGEDEVPF